MSISGYGNNGKPPAPTSYANSQAAERQQIFLLDEYSNEKRHKAAVAAAAATRNQLTSNGGGGGGVALVDDPTHDMSFNNDYQSEPYEYTPNGVSMLPSLDHRNKYLKAHAGHPPPPP